MPTTRQISVHDRLGIMFGRTPIWRSLHAGRDFSRMAPEDAYVFLGHLFDGLKRWRFRRLPRAVGLPRSDEDRLLARERSRAEEAVARLAVPDGERDSWQVDQRPSALGSPIPYQELNPELEEALEVDYPGFSQFRSARPL